MASLKYGSIKDVDDGKLSNLIQCVEGGNLDDTKSELFKFLGSISDGYSQPVLVRAKVYSRLIAVALGLTPQDVRLIDKVKREERANNVWTSTEDQRERVDYFTLLSLGEKWGDDGLVVLRYLLKEVLEEDDNVMTVIFGIGLEEFKKHPVKYFVGCTPDVFEQIQDLWLTDDVLKEFYFNKVYIIPIVERVKQAKSTKDKNFIQAKLMLCEQLQQRSLKAGARLFWLVAKKRKSGERQVHGNDDIDLVGELVKDIFNIDAENNYASFKDNFLVLWDNYWSNLDLSDYSITDREYDGHDQLICVGQVSSPANTDGNLLCWAARRNYHDLIWCVMQAYTPLTKSDIGFNYWIEERVTMTWRFALWCATRHGDFWKVIEELSFPNWTKDIDFNDYPSGWLPPLHLAALYGDVEIMDTLCAYLRVESCANKKDYLGRTPLDYAMQFKTTNKIRYPFSKKVKDYETPGHKDVVKKLLHMKGVGERLKELYDMYIHQANTVLIGAALIASVTFAGWLQPPLSYREYFQFTRPSPPNGSVYYQSYVAIEGHPSIEVFVVFNTLSFFSAIATMFIGAEATLYVHDNDERTSSLIRMRKSIKWMIGFFVTSMMCIMSAFISAGIAILPPIQRLEWSMIVSLVVGGGTCTIPLSWILWSLFKTRILSFIEWRLINEVKNKKSDSSTERSTSEPSLLSKYQVKKIEDQFIQMSQPSCTSQSAENQDIQGGGDENDHISEGKKSSATSEGQENSTVTSKEEDKNTATSREQGKSTMISGDGETSTPTPMEGENNITTTSMNGENNITTSEEEKNNATSEEGRDDATTSGEEEENNITTS